MRPAPALEPLMLKLKDLNVSQTSQVALTQASV